MSATTGYRRFAEELHMMIEAAREHGLADDPIIRQRPAEYPSKLQIIRIHGLRSLTQPVTGKTDPSVREMGATNTPRWSERNNADLGVAARARTTGGTERRRAEGGN